ncbi:TIGR03757 family integrating conjugative element protein [Stutzerimonas nitrititolerans]|uniref:TIGR03757 family integrating conjugative element protein n=1 Tax=Stutzerimonas nitrititolerans TaxID=2482751 RepID=UPI0028A5A845|nr:TIGR03757 family integrating conjugative element protein [Stutzerimonas nitrititolerans]
MAETIVVTDSQHPVINSGNARVIELDRPAQLSYALSQGLPADPQRAASAAKERLSSEEGRRLTAELRRAYQDVADAKGLKVQKVPAVIVDRTYVVYGLADVAEATGLIDAYLQGEH